MIPPPVGLSLRPDHWKIVVEEVARYLPGVEVWAFGSRVNGSPRPTSDLDVVVVDDSPLLPATLGALREAFDESALPFRVDVLEWSHTRPEFREIIEKGRVVVQKKG